MGKKKWQKKVELDFGEGIIGKWATGAVPIRSGLSTINQAYLTANVNLKLMDRMRACQYFTMLLRLILLRHDHKG